MNYEVAYYHTDIFHTIRCIPIKDYGKPPSVGCNLGYDPGYTMNGKLVPHIGADRTISEGDVVVALAGGQLVTQGTGVGLSGGAASPTGNF